MDRQTLMDITGQEAGIVVYGDEVIVANWSSFNSGLPIMSPFNTVMEWPQDEPLEVAEEWHVDDVRDALPGKIVRFGKDEVSVEDMEIMSDVHGDLPALWGYDTGNAYINRDSDGNLIPTCGTCYRIGEAIVIAPDGWC